MDEYCVSLQMKTVAKKQITRCAQINDWFMAAINFAAEGETPKRPMKLQSNILSSELGVSQWFNKCKNAINNISATKLMTFNITAKNKILIIVNAYLCAVSNWRQSLSVANELQPLSTYSVSLLKN